MRDDNLHYALNDVAIDGNWCLPLKSHWLKSLALGVPLVRAFVAFSRVCLLCHDFTHATRRSFTASSLFLRFSGTFQQCPNNVIDLEMTKICVGLEGVVRTGVSVLLPKVAGIAFDSLT